MTSFWEFFWLVVEIFVLVAYVMVLFHILVDIVRDQALSGGIKALWIVGLIFFPILAAIIYLIARGSGMHEREQARAADLRNRTEQYMRDVAGSSPATEIANAKALLDDGAITEDEFDHLKTRALAHA